MDFRDFSLTFPLTKPPTFPDFKQFDLPRKKSIKPLNNWLALNFPDHFYVNFPDFSLTKFKFPDFSPTCGHPDTGIEPGASALDSYLLIDSESMSMGWYRYRGATVRKETSVPLHYRTRFGQLWTSLTRNNVELAGLWNFSRALRVLQVNQGPTTDWACILLVESCLLIWMMYIHM